MNEEDRVETLQVVGLTILLLTVFPFILYKIGIEKDNLWVLSCDAAGMRNNGNVVGFPPTVASDEYLYICDGEERWLTTPYSDMPERKARVKAEIESQYEDYEEPSYVDKLRD